MRVLYAGPALAGVTTSVHALANAMGVAIEKKFSSRTGFVTQAHEVWSDVRTNLWFFSLENALARYRTDTSDAHLKLFEVHAEYLRIVEGVVFVADSQIERREANLESVERLDRDLRHVGRDPMSIGVVFACNKQDLPRARPIPEMSPELRWTKCAHVATSAKTGMGVVEAFEALASL